MERNCYMIETYILKIDKKLELDEFYMLLEYVSETKKKQVNKYNRFIDAERTLIGAVMARYALCKRLKIKNSDLVFDLNKYKKPIVIKPNEIHFNISHSGSWVVCVVDDNKIGVDVEIVRPINFIIAKKFFSQKEYTYLLNQNEKMKLKYFYRLWTLKESYIKAEGKGMSIPLNSFTINETNNCIQVYDDGKLQDYVFHQSFLDSNTSFAICASDVSEINSFYFSIEQFVKEVSSILN